MFRQHCQQIPNMAARRSLLDEDFVKLRNRPQLRVVRMLLQPICFIDKQALDAALAPLYLAMASTTSPSMRPDGLSSLTQLWCNSSKSSLFSSRMMSSFAKAPCLIVLYRRSFFELFHSGPSTRVILLSV